MPRTTREWALREIQNARNNIDWSGKHLYVVAQRYEKEHPEISDPILVVLAALLDLDEALSGIRKLF